MGEEVVTVPDDETLLDLEGPQLGSVDEIALDSRTLLNMYVTGILLLLTLLALNYVTWRHYVKALSSVLLEPSRRQ